MMNTSLPMKIFTRSRLDFKAIIIDGGAIEQDSQRIHGHYVDRTDLNRWVVLDKSA